MYIRYKRRALWGSGVEHDERAAAARSSAGRTRALPLFPSERRGTMRKHASSHSAGASTGSPPSSPASFRRARGGAARTHGLSCASSASPTPTGRRGSRPCVPGRSARWMKAASARSSAYRRYAPAIPRPDAGRAAEEEVRSYSTLRRLRDCHWMSPRATATLSRAIAKSSLKTPARVGASASTITGGV